MSRPRTNAETHDWTGTHAATGAVPADGAGEGVGALDPAALMAQLLGEFDAVLAGNPALDREAREGLHAEFARALEDAAATAADAVAELPDRASWADTVHALQHNGAIGDDEANDLIRTFDASLQPLERRESRTALEFARRLATEGEEKALAWFRAQAAGAAGAGAAAQPAPAPGSAGAALRTEAVSARSHRLRGPPRR